MLQHKFVISVPDPMEEGILYVSIEYCTAMHKCVCGCGNEVVTPISPNDWQLTFNGNSISLSPSIGNWNFDCQSHYWIIENQIIHAKSRHHNKIDFGRKADRSNKSNSYSENPKRLKSKNWRSLFLFFKNGTF
ncbi:MAG TPA: DUF6527 family protein [Hanamia sp.]